MCTVIVNWELVLKYLAVFLSWPFMVFVIVLFVSLNFKESISQWLRTLKVQYGDTVLSSNQPVEANKKEVQLLEKQNNPLDGKATFLKSLSEDDPSTLKQMVANWRENAYIWEYKYLNYFLVPHTKDVLYWLYRSSSANFESYNNIFSQQILDLTERIAVLTSLENHFLIQPIKDGHLEITEKGKEYAEVMLIPMLNRNKKSE